MLQVGMLSLLAVVTASQGRAYPPKMNDAREEVYKKVDDVELKMYIFQPKDHKPGDRRATVVFFFGGGWKSGTPAQFHEHCKHLASKGIVAMTADYRVSTRHQTRAKHCVEDGKSAIRWVRQNAKRLGVDPKRVVAAGGSAGGHVAACTGVIEGFEASTEDRSISSVPNAMALFNPAVALAPLGGEFQQFSERAEEFRERMGVEPQQLSPVHHVRPGLPPTVIFHGKADTTVPFRTVEVFAEKMTKAGNRCVLYGFPDKTHGFFNFGREGGKSYQITVQQLGRFLKSLGYIE